MCYSVSLHNFLIKVPKFIFFYFLFSSVSYAENDQQLCHFSEFKNANKIFGSGALEINSLNIHANHGFGDKLHCITWSFSVPSCLVEYSRRLKDEIPYGVNLTDQQYNYIQLARHFPEQLKGFLEKTSVEYDLIPDEVGVKFSNIKIKGYNQENSSLDNLEVGKFFNSINGDQIVDEQCKFGIMPIKQFSNKLEEHINDQVHKLSNVNNTKGDSARDSSQSSSNDNVARHDARDLGVKINEVCLRETTDGECVQKGNQIITTVKINDITINNIIVNKGNCKNASEDYAPGAKIFPKKGKFGEQMSIVVYCDPILIQYETDKGSYSYDVNQ